MQQQTEVVRERRFRRVEPMPTHVVPDGANDSLIVRAMHAGLMPVLRFIPTPHWAVRRFLEWDNRIENARDAWDRLRDVNEMGRYRTIQGFVETFAPGGSVLDVGCAQGILQEGLRYGDYTGVDLFAATLATARGQGQPDTRYVVGSAETYVPDRDHDAIVFNETLYYPRHPVAEAQRFARHLAPGGVIIVSLFNRAWWPRRLMRRLDAALGAPVAETRVFSGQGAGWTIRVYRPGAVSARPRG